MAIFRIEVNVVIDEEKRDIIANIQIYKERFIKFVYEYLNSKFDNNYNVTKIELEIDEWNIMEEKLKLPYIMYNFPDSRIFINDDMLCIEDYKLKNMISCEAKIIKTEDKICLISTCRDIKLVNTDKYIDKFVVKEIKNIVHTGSISDDNFEFYEPTLKLCYKKGKLTKS